MYAYKAHWSDLGQTGWKNFNIKLFHNKNHEIYASLHGEDQINSKFLKSLKKEVCITYKQDKSRNILMNEMSNMEKLEQHF